MPFILQTGDTAYPLTRNLLKPYADRADNSATIRRYNKKLSATRVIVENANARLKNKWRRLKKLNVLSAERARLIVRACIVLHNLVLYHDTEVPPTPDTVARVIPRHNDAAGKRDAISTFLSLWFTTLFSLLSYLYVTTSTINLFPNINIQTYNIFDFLIFIPISYTLHYDSFISSQYRNRKHLIYFLLFDTSSLSSSSFCFSISTICCRKAVFASTSDLKIFTFSSSKLRVLVPFGLRRLLTGGAFDLKFLWLIVTLRWPIAQHSDVGVYLLAALIDLHINLSRVELLKLFIEHIEKFKVSRITPCNTWKCSMELFTRAFRQSATSALHMTYRFCCCGL